LAVETPFPQIKAPLLITPGLGGSSPDHWQSHWERMLPDATRVLQADWDAPDLDAWLDALARTVRDRPNAFVVAHSLGCILLAHLAVRDRFVPVRGALLVAPPDVDSPWRAPEAIRGFAPTPLAALPFPSIVAASRTDPYAPLARSAWFAQQWGSEFVDLGDLGHVNAASNIGSWMEGLDLITRLEALAAGPAGFGSDVATLTFPEAAL
jgi:predicted alpha/beta hydrolase family esterase